MGIIQNKFEVVLSYLTQNIPFTYIKMKTRLSDTLKHKSDNLWNMSTTFELNCFAIFIKIDPWISLFWFRRKLIKPEVRTQSPHRKSLPEVILRNLKSETKDLDIIFFTNLIFISSHVNFNKLDTFRPS